MHRRQLGSTPFYTAVYEVLDGNEQNPRIKLVGDAMGSEDFGFIFPKGSDLVAPINAGIAELQEDGTLDKLNTTWFLDYKLGQ